MDNYIESDIDIEINGRYRVFSKDGESLGQYDCVLNKLYHNGQVLDIDTLAHAIRVVTSSVSHP